MDEHIRLTMELRFTGPHSLLLGSGKRQAWFRKTAIIDHGDGTYTVPSALVKLKGLLDENS